MTIAAQIQHIALEFASNAQHRAVNRRALVTPSVSIKSDTCGADRRRDPTPKHRARHKAVQYRLC